MKVMNGLEHLFLFFVKKAVIVSKSFFTINQIRKKLSGKINNPLKQGAVYKVYRS